MGQTLLQIGMVSFIGIACIDTLMFKLLNKSNVTNHRLGYQGKLTTVASVIMCCLIVVGIVSTADEYIASLRNGVSAGVYVFTYELLLLLLVCVLELALTNKKTEDLDKVSDIRKGANLLLSCVLVYKFMICYVICCIIVYVANILWVICIEV